MAMRLLRELGWLLMCALVAWVTYAGLNDWTWGAGSLTTWAPIQLHALTPTPIDVSMYLFALMLVAIRYGVRLGATLERRHLGAGIGLMSALAAMSALSWWSRGMVPFVAMPRRYATYVAEGWRWQDELRFTLPWLLATFASSALCTYLAGRLCRGAWQGRNGVQGESGP